jgi:hypothetical protein
VQALVPGGEVDAADDLGKELAVQVGQQHADRVRAVRDQAAGGAVGPEAQALGDGAHPAARVLVHALAVVEDARDGRNRDAGLARHVLDRRHGESSPEGGGRCRR